MIKVVTVNRLDHVTGTAEKAIAHRLGGILHRAASVVVYNRKGEILVQQRSRHKSLWPLYWSNTCCTHGLIDENILTTGERRLKEEMGFTCRLKPGFKLYYQADYQHIGSEHELTHVLFGQYDGQVKPNAKEAAAFRWLSLKQLKKEIKSNQCQFTPWFIKIMKKINTQTISTLGKH